MNGVQSFLLALSALFSIVNPIGSALIFSQVTAYSFADRIVAFLGRAQARIVTRLAAFLLLCVGVQITLNGIMDFVRGL